ncbi:porin [Limibacter armeniacum]|uniref:porin n=1 Tax=Limibacter armeniacum TaxID=466084 RepID=UPI002FE6869A
MFSRLGYIMAVLFLTVQAGNSYAFTQADSVVTDTTQVKTVDPQKSVVSIENKPFGKSLVIDTNGPDFKFSLEGRVQTRFDVVSLDGDNTQELYFRRARLKSGGYLFSEKLGYKLEFDLINNEVLDAVLKWKFLPNTSLWVGQTKLAGNRERVVSSQNMQFVDRSRLNADYNIDRDLGVQLHHKFSVKDWVIKGSVAVSTGEGKNYNYVGEQELSDGLAYTGRIDFLPFGNFKSKGDYVESDLERESTPKLAVGFTYSTDDNAIRDRGQRGSVLSGTRDLESYFADFIFKYRGFSMLGEYAHKSTDGETPVVIDTAERFESFRTGQGMNLQAGYLLKSNWEFAGRFTEIWPEEVTGREHVQEYTVGVSKYIMKHKIKAQSDFSYSDFDVAKDEMTWRLQVELSF